MTESKQILLCGVGGQGIVTAGGLLGAAAFGEGRHVSGTSSYGAAARGGECRAEVVISDSPVAFPFVTTADILVALSQSAYDRYLGWTAERSGVVFHDTLLVSPLVAATQRHIGISATQSTEEVLGSNLGANIVMLAAVVEVVGPIGKGSFLRPLSRSQSARC
jgi:2-oxoglutarate ferredoxin oxidoreductase subunit gamma